jgi:peptidoglycan/LPS O-acetylase OafA/YrhL
LLQALGAAFTAALQHAAAPDNQLPHLPPGFLLVLRSLGADRLGFLDQLRALAIIPVVVSHYHSDWLPGGGIGVGIFFALSGFLIGTILLEMPQFGIASVGKFLVRRFARIYPAYVLSITLIVLLSMAVAPARCVNVIEALPGLLTMLDFPSAWLGYGVGVLWTLHIEFAFYISTPLFMLLLGRQRGLLWFCIALLVSSGVATAVAVPLHSFAHYGAGLGVGALVALAWKSDRFAHLSTRMVGAILAVAMTGIVLLLFLPPVNRYAWLAECLAASLFASGLIVTFLATPSLPTFSALTWIGRISYSIYLLHGVILDYAPSLGLGPYAHPARFAVIVLVLSSISYYWVEKPGISLGRHFSTRVFASPMTVGG